MAETIFVLAFSCDNRPGIVAAASTSLFQEGGNILDAQQFDDVETGRFFGRIVFNVDAVVKQDAVSRKLETVFAPFGMTWSMRDVSTRRRVMLLVSKDDHCLADLLYRWRTGEIEMDIAGVISNHPVETFKHLHFSSMPFHYLPVTKETKPEQEARIWELIQRSQTDLVVLARYMQILSDDLSRKLSGMCINIHHSFLPGFKGAKPYHQAHTRGVKLIGATAHYVTGDLDEGLIIEQIVQRVDHSYTPEMLSAVGRDSERRALSTAARLLLEHRVFLDDQKTVVFK